MKKRERVLYPVPEYRPKPLQPRRDWVEFWHLKMAELDAIAQAEGLRDEEQLELEDTA